MKLLLAVILVASCGQSDDKENKRTHSGSEPTQTGSELPTIQQPSVAPILPPLPQIADAVLSGQGEVPEHAHPHEHAQEVTDHEHPHAHEHTHEPECTVVLSDPYKIRRRCYVDLHVACGGESRSVTLSAEKHQCDTL